MSGLRAMMRLMPEPAAVWSSGLHDGQVALASSFFEVKCAQGFQCVSKIGAFGEAHDGQFHRGAGVTHLAKHLQDAYESACPARGQMDSGGSCEDDGRQGSAGGMCFSPKRFEAGTGTPCGGGDKCMCVRPFTSHGDKEQRNVSTNVIDGKEIYSGHFEVQPMAKCDDCSQHDGDKDMCNRCSNCEFLSKDVKVSGREATRHQDGCFKRSDGRLGDDLQQRFLKGESTQQKLLHIVPHYAIWDPNEPSGEQLAATKPTHFPNQNRLKFLGRDSWIHEYKKAAPRVQRMMDLLVMRMLEGTGTEGAWSPLADSTGSSGMRRADSMRCWTPDKAGDDVTRRLDEFLSSQKACKVMQETANKIARGVMFSAGSDSCGAFSWDDQSQVRTCGCHRGAGRDASMCSALNCYNEREDILNAVEALRQKAQICAGAVAIDISEINENGQRPPGSTEVLMAGTVQQPEVAVDGHDNKNTEGSAGTVEAHPSVAPEPIDATVVSLIFNRSTSLDTNASSCGVGRLSPRSQLSSPSWFTPRIRSGTDKQCPRKDRRHAGWADFLCSRV
eukprot:TRINITY_DN45837_c0_g1_i1.p1 TRINITY_DN45837_c0_g1~~TRINITY_DN45837_c0_g1_i1.p1  ORF type:complete len:558 (-),score=81.77 TRINITY_DN45837_c0_g1_i1:171-1844(-)